MAMRVCLSAWLLALLLQTCSVYAIDIVHYNKSHSEIDERDSYPLRLLTLALEKTKQKYGEYKIEYSLILFKRNRALRELNSGEKLNVYSAPTRKEWEEQALAVYFPIYKGLLSYRRLLINQNDAEKFEEITDIEQLKALKTGLGRQWSTTQTLAEQHFNIVTSTSYEGLFGMLSMHRFDYYIRGINEIYYEFEARKAKYPNMIIENSIVLNIPLPVFLFVSPQCPRLHRRIKEGLWTMHQDGSFEVLFNEYHADFIKRTDIEHKKVFYIGNDSLGANGIYNNNALWFDPKQY